MSNAQIQKHKYTNTQIQHITKCQKDPTYGIFLKGDCSRISPESRTVVQGLVTSRISRALDRHSAFGAENTKLFG